jgi:tRNA dimethylallyltransferase
MQGIPHHLIDIREPEESFSAGDFVQDADALIADMTARGVTPILAGGSHFYFDALVYGLPGAVPNDEQLRERLEAQTNEQLLAEIEKQDPRRANMLDPQNRRRLIRALEVIEKYGHVPERTTDNARYEVDWVVINPDRDELRPRIDARLQQALEGGLINEVRATRERVGDERLTELGLEYSVIGEYLRGERSKDTLLSTLSTRLWHYARRQKAWLRKLQID